MPFLRKILVPITFTGLGAVCNTLHGHSRSGEALVDDPPKGSHRPFLGVEKILEEATLVKWWRIRIASPILAKFRHPIIGLASINNLKETSGIEIGMALIVQNPQIISLNPDHHVQLSRRQVW